MNDGLYNPKKFVSSGKPVETAPVTTDAPPAAARVEGGNKEKVVDPPAPDPVAVEAEKTRIAAQSNMTPEQIAADNAQAADAKLTPEQKQEKETARIAAETATKDTEAKLEAAALKKILDKLGVTTLDELAAKMPGKVETPEEVTKREQNLKANVAQFAVKHNILSMDEITSFENLKKQDKRDLAYNAFAADYKETHKDRTEVDGDTKVPVTSAEIDDAFNDFFHLNSDNTALKKSGEKQLDAYAKSVMGDTEEKYNDTVEAYKEYEARKNYFPTFKNAIKEIAASVPAELSWGEGEDKVVFATDKLDKAAIEKLYSTDAAYDAFYNAKGDPNTIESLRKEFNNRLIVNNIDAIVKNAHAVGRDLGKKEGSDVGAKNPFNDKKAEGTNVDPAIRATKTREDYRKEQAKYFSGARN